MRSITLTLATVLVVIASFSLSVSAQAVVGSSVVVFSLASGGGNNEQSENGVTTLFVASEETRNMIDPTKIRQVVIRGCFSRNSRGDRGTDLSLKNLFDRAMDEKTFGKWVVLRAVRVFDPRNLDCAYIWFTYIEDTFAYTEDRDEEGREEKQEQE